MESNNLASPPEQNQSRPGMLSLIFGVFTKPSETFGHLTKKTDWLIPLLIIAVIGTLLGHFVRPIMVRDMTPVVLKNIEKYRDMMPPERFAEIQDQVKQQQAEAEKNEFKWYYPLIGLLLPFVFMVVIAAIGKMGGDFIYGGKAGFWIVMNVVAFAALIGLLGDVVRSLMVLGKDSMWVYTGLGILKPVDDGTFTFYLLRQIDLFSIWRIVATCIGLGVIYKMKAARFAYVLFPLWLVFIIIVALLNVYVMSGGLIY